MGSTRRHTLLVLCALAALVGAPSAAAKQSLPKIPIPRPALTWLRGDGNYTKASRKPTSIRWIVIHATEGPFWGSVWWLKNRHSHASANYIVGRNGSIVQIVHLSDVAWHTGNAYYNRHSVGIEHEGITDDPAGFTAAEYRASARLAAWLARRSLIPIDRAHLIGHSQVPDPFEPGTFGGSDHHTDPGGYWDWKLYLRLVRHYAYPAPPIRVASATVYAGQTVTGKVPWGAAAKGPVQRVDFLVDGKLRWSDRRAPFAYGTRGVLDTLPLPNGRHVLKLVAHGPNGGLAYRGLTVRVRNRPFVLTTAGVRRGAKVKGLVRFTAAAVGTPLDSIRLYVDGRLRTTEARPPYRFALDTRRLPDGIHTLDLRSRAFDGRTAWRRLRVVVANAKPLPKPVVVGQSIAEGQTLQGVAGWQVFVKRPVLRVDFLVDGAVVGSSTTIPYAFSWDTSAAQPGPHSVVARVVGKGGTVETKAVAVTVAPAAALASTTASTTATIPGP